MYSDFKKGDRVVHRDTGNFPATVTWVGPRSEAGLGSRITVRYDGEKKTTRSFTKLHKLER